MRGDAWAGALLWCNIQVWFYHNSGLFLHTASLKCAKTSWYNVCLPSDHVVQYKFMMDNAFPIKKQQTSPDLWPTPLCFLVEETLSPSTVTMFLRKFLLPFASASSTWLISARFSFWLSVNKRGINYALTWCIWSFSVKIWWQDPMLMPTSSATSWTVKWWFPRITVQTLSTWSW